MFVLAASPGPDGTVRPCKHADLCVPLRYLHAMRLCVSLQARGYVCVALRSLHYVGLRSVSGGLPTI